MKTPKGFEVSVYLSDLTKDEFGALVSGTKQLVALLPVGSVEPHGPHLPLGTDTLISRAASERAAQILADNHIKALIAPSIPYGVTQFAAGFPGMVGVAEKALASWIQVVVRSLLSSGFVHVSLVNNHLEPAHDRAVRAGLGDLLGFRASVACPLERRFARTLSDEFKSGACHAGRYETSLILASDAELVRAEVARSLPEVPISLSDGIRAGKTTFDAMGMKDAYAGAPGLATAEEGREQLEHLANMVKTVVLEGLALSPADRE